jgi:hypothetical protein
MVIMRTPAKTKYKECIAAGLLHHTGVIVKATARNSSPLAVAALAMTVSAAGRSRMPAGVAALETRSHETGLSPTQREQRDSVGAHGCHRRHTSARDRLLMVAGDGAETGSNASVKSRFIGKAVDDRTVEKAEAFAERWARAARGVSGDR